MNAKSFLIALAAAVAAPCAALSQDFPGGKPVRLVVPFPPGVDVFDGTARMVAKKLGESLGVPVIVDNRPGAGGVIANQAVASAAPDGHTLLYGIVASLTLLPHQLARRPYDEFRDFSPITYVARSPLFLMAHPSVPAKNLGELVAYAKAKPDQQLAFASWQFGGLNQVYLEMLKAQAGIDMVHVPYKSPDDALKDLLQGRIQLMMGASQSHVDLVRAGKLNALAATGGARMRSMPDLPTFAEQGFSGYEQVGGIAIFGPGGMAPATVGKLNADLTRVLRMPDVVEFFVKLVPTVEIEPSTPAELGAQMRAQYDAMGPIIRKLGIHID